MSGLVCRSISNPARARTNWPPRLRGQSGVQHVTAITQDEALAEFMAQTHLGDALGALDTNPLPASLRVVPTPEAGAADLERLAALAGEGSGVAEVVIERTWLERVAAASIAARRVGSILAVLFGIGALLVTATSVRLAIEGRLQELKVMKLVGASDGQVRRPFLYLGMLYGLGGGLVAAMLLSRRHHYRGKVPLRISWAASTWNSGLKRSMPVSWGYCSAPV